MGQAQQGEEQEVVGQEEVEEPAECAVWVLAGGCPPLCLAPRSEVLILLAAIVSGEASAMKVEEVSESSKVSCGDCRSFCAVSGVVDAEESLGESPREVGYLSKGDAIFVTQLCL